MIRLNGSDKGARYPVRGPLLRVGRDRSGDVVLRGPDSSTVSGRHLEIRAETEGFRLVDLSSTNGTYLDGQRISEAVLRSNSVIQLGPDGPQFQFKIETDRSDQPKRTQISPARPDQLTQPSVGKASIQILRPAQTREEHEDLVADAVSRARQARTKGGMGQTTIIMREMLGRAIHRSSRKLKSTVGVLLFLVFVLLGYAAWSLPRLKAQKASLDQHIQQLEEELRAAGKDPKRVEQLIAELNRYTEQARQVQKSLLYQLGVRDEEQDFIESEIRKLMSEFGSEVYSIPPEFLEQVRRFTRQYQTRDRALIERTLGRSRKNLESVREQLRSENLPPDLAYMVLVESAFIAGDSSSAGALGFWQFTEATARAYGLRVTEAIDERLDARKSTQAAARYIRELILEFGAGSSVMLALAAYNLGPGKVRRAVRQNVEDPIKQRNFWYLYRVRALPPETREYVPKIVAAIIIGRNPQRFGFERT
ncbi:MAG: transglycosylase SLT domain-containing protein [Acidobacteriota bacterium]